MEVLAIFVYVMLLFSTFLSYFTPKRKQRQKAELPPGSLGWPYIGETRRLYSQDPNEFFFTKQRRYGNIFKTHILGYPCVMMASPEAARFVLVTHAHLFKPTYPQSKEKLIGPSALFFHEGSYHSHLRKLILKSFSPEAIRKLIPEIENIAISALQSWASGEVINTFHEMKKFSLEIAILSMFGRLDKKHEEELKENYSIVNQGYNCFPSDLPGSAYNKAILARKRIGEILSEVISERKDKKPLRNDLLGRLLNFKDEKGQTFTEEQIADNIIGVLFAAQDTTASALTWVLKYLKDNLEVLESVKEEHNAIYSSNNGGQDFLTWAQIRMMLLTHRVVLESLRMSSIISFTFREAVADVEYEGFLIPKGWKVMPLFRNIHHNSEFFVDPGTFNPSRFEVPPKANTYMPFGIGSHACPGNELAKLQILILVHHLVTKFRWEVVVSGTGTELNPFLIPREGLPAKFLKK